MATLEIIILAVVQALTEFLPVSSSGHLIIAEEFSSIDSQIGIDVMLHFGTLIALVVYFWNDLVDLLKKIIKKENPKLVWLLAISTIPAVVVGLMFGDFFTDNLRNAQTVAIMLAVVGIAMMLVDRFFKNDQLAIEKMNFVQALKVGAWQVLAFVPGTSRSGITMLAGRSIGMSHDQSARYSFLIGIPIIFAATVGVLFEPESRYYISNQLTETVIGVLVSFVVGLAAIKVALSIVRKVGLKYFGIYRIGLSVLVVLILLMN